MTHSATNNPSSTLQSRALRVIPGGVNSPVRAFNAVGGDPLFVVSGNGSRIRTHDGRELIDFCGSWGPLILGHAHPAVVAAITEAAAAGTSFGISTPREVEFAELLCHQVPSLDQVRLVNSGTEATMTALRLARGVTGRELILKFDGCYHGHADGLLVAAGSGLLTGGLASSAGIAPHIAADVLIAPYNDVDAVTTLMARHGDRLAAVIVEPVAGNMGLIPPVDGFLETLRKLTHQYGTILIFDEVISGFRLAPTTYGTTCGITPDLTCLGKIIGGGMPIGAVGGRRDIMEHLAPNGPVYQAGTLSGNPVAVAAGMATLQTLINDPPYERLTALGQRLADGLPDGNGHHLAGLGGMWTLFFQAGPVRNLADAKRCDTDAYARFFHRLLAQGIYLPPSQFETAFISATHTEDDIDTLIGAITG